jgi:uncharacterized RDD family membrane protein YckC
MTAPGWYNAEGDPPGTTRYWDGERWVGDPVHTPASSPESGGYMDTSAGQRFNLASPGSRIAARLIDFLIALIIGFALLVPAITDLVDDIDALGPDPSQAQVEDVLSDVIEDNIGRLAIFSIVGVLWDFLWVGVFGGTPGKLILGLRVARADNGVSPPGWGKAALRALNRVVALVPGLGGLIAGLIGLVSLIMLFSDDQNRTVMDRIASTVVVKK